MDDPRTSMILGLASGLLAPVQGNRGFGAALSQGLLSGMQGYQQGAQMQDQRASRQAAMEAQKRQAEIAGEELGWKREDRVRDDQARQQAMQQRAQIEAQLMQMDPTGKMLTAYRINPQSITERMFPKVESPFGKIDQKDYTGESIAAFSASITPDNPQGDRTLLKPRTKSEFVNGVAVDPYSVRPGAVMPNPNQPFMLTQTANGYEAVPNKPYQQYEMGKASAGATRVNVPVSVNTEKKFTETLAGEIGKTVVQGRDAAEAATNSLGTINRIESALNSGKVMAGPGTSPVMLFRQIGEVAGIGGANNEEVLRNTRTAIQGTAQLSLDGAKQLAGQGQVTEFERKMVERAASGDVASMTVPELRTLMQVQRKVAESKIRAHQQNVSRLRNVEGAAPVVPFFDVAPPAAQGWKIEEVR